MEIAPKNEPAVNLRYRLWSSLTRWSLLLSEAAIAPMIYFAVTRSPVSWFKSFIYLACILLISQFLTRIVIKTKWQNKNKKLFMAGWIIFSMFVSLKALLYPDETIFIAELILRPITNLIYGSGLREFGHLLMIALINWYGISTAKRTILIDDVVSVFEIGLLLALISGILIAPQNPPLWTYASLFFFTFFCLISMSIARIAYLSNEHGGRLPAFNVRWGLTIVLASLLAVGLGILATWTLSGKVAEGIVASLGMVLVFILSLLFIIFLPVLYAIVWVVNQIMIAIVPKSEVITPPPLEQAMEKIVYPNTDILQNTFDINSVIRPVILIGILLMVLFIAIKTLRSREKSTTYLIEENIQDIQKSPKLKKDASSHNASFWKKIIHPRQMLAAARIRQVYAQLLDLCRRAGQKRPPAQTPLEFTVTIESLFPERKEEILLITQAYLKVRYGELPENDQEVEQVVAAWNKIKSQGKAALAHNS